MEAETRMREATAETERVRTRVHHLQRDLARLEETSKTLLQHKQCAEQLKQEKTTLKNSYEARIQQYQNQISKLQLDCDSMRGELKNYQATTANDLHKSLLNKYTNLQNDHLNLTRDAELQRKKYERCLDDVANQVVRALLSQKGLKEEISALQRRIRELEAQNRALSSLLTQATSPGTPNELVKGILEAGPAALVAALGLDSTWFPISRPKSLNLQIPVMATAKCRKARPIGQKPITASVTAAPVEEEGSESPESGNRDEGYSTMSSDVQGEGTRQEAPRGLEDLKEATDETEADVSPDCRLVSLDTGDPDVLFLPLNLTIGLNPRHSFPPTKDIVPFQHVMRSFSDSHLCLKLTATSITPYNIASPAGSSLLLVEDDGWDAEYVQQWLRLDDSRSSQQHRDLLELEYDRAELEDWSFSLSTEDLTSGESGLVWKDPITPASTTAIQLPAIKENHNNIELEEDSNEFLWNGSSYLFMENKSNGPWPYSTSPNASWSSEEGILDNSSKRSSAALSGCSDDAESPSIGTDFTRDFYRLVKFESTKSLASTSSRGGKNLSERENALQSVLSFIAEQQTYLTEYSDLNAQDDCEKSPQIEVEEITSNNHNSEISSSETDEIIEREEEKTKKSNEELLDEISVPILAPEERLVNAVSCNNGISYTTVAPSELGAVPEEDEDATSSTPSTVISPSEQNTVLVEGKDRTLSFHEKATSKDVIDVLNRMIKKGEDNTTKQDNNVALEKLDIQCCCPTGWVHVERDIDFNDPKTRANLLDGMLDVESSSTTSSGSAGSDSGDEPLLDYHHFHNLHRYRRQKKASAAQAQRVLRLPSSLYYSRPSIVGRGNDFYMRYGEKEKEAVASFDFLNDIPIYDNLIVSNDNNDNNDNNKILDFNNTTLTTLQFDKISPTNNGGRFNTERMKISPL